MLKPESKGEDGICPKCGGPTSYRQAHRYPVISQILFGLSFILFIVFNERVSANPTWLWGWSIGQIFLGLILIRGRLRARERILRCIRCSETLG